MADEYLEKEMQRLLREQARAEQAPRRLLSEVEEVIRSMPDLVEWGVESEANDIWFGRVRAVIKAWDPIAAVMFGDQIARATTGNRYSQREVVQTLHQVRFGLRMDVGVPETVAINSGGVYDYFDEVRKVIAIASRDVLFIDPYLDAEFVSRYFGLIRASVTVRLLAHKHVHTSLLPAVRQWNQQHGDNVQVRSDPKLHDRYVIIDGADIYLSGASFKDGGRKAGTVISQLRDSAGAVIQQYEQQWAAAKVEV